MNRRLVLAVSACLTGLVSLGGTSLPASGQCLPEGSEAKLLAPDGLDDDNFGRSVAIDGNVAVVGAPGRGDLGDFTGAAYVFERSGGVWNAITKLIPAILEFEQEFGYSVDVEGDLAVVGAPFGIGPGAVFVYVRTGGIWIEEAKITPRDGEGGDEFGFSVAISGETVIVGSRKHGVHGGPQAGAAYVYIRNSGAWTEQQELLAPNTDVGDRFGHSVAIDGDSAAIGARDDFITASGQVAGSAHVFVRVGAAWTHQGMVVADDGVDGDEFGGTVAISADALLVAAQGVDDGGEETGRVYAFARDAGAWSQVDKFKADDTIDFDNFGVSIGISGDTAVIGAWLHDHPATDMGAAYVFARNGDTWRQQEELTASDARTDDWYGFAVDISATSVIIGARLDDNAGGFDAGAAYVVCSSTSPEDCTDGQDNDGDALVDCEDDDCAAEPQCMEAGNCFDGTDNDVDGLTDCADDDCAAEALCMEAGNCFDGTDNDVDGLTDCADDDCATEPPCMEAGNCFDGMDNDVDGFTDCADDDCATEPPCMEAGNCFDGMDNDVDGRTDCADADCATELPCMEAGNCFDGMDNDVDGLTDCEDDDCAAEPACIEAGNCMDDVDNDVDGLTDCEDDDCAAEAHCIETGNCMDDVDNDVDGLTDCEDDDCAAEAHCIETGNCMDDIDNDVDGLTDCEDDECAAEAHCIETGNCMDGIDNDVDGLTDCEDDECAAEAHCIEGGNCIDDVDNDIDGLTDCEDDDCAGEAHCIEAGNCMDDIDNDVDGLTDCEDDECFGLPHCDEALNCTDGVDNDADGLTDEADPDCGACDNVDDDDSDGNADCLDEDCVFDAACADEDWDSDGATNSTDCAPLDATAFELPAGIDSLSVGNTQGTDEAVVSWPDLGMGVTYEVASDLLSTLAANRVADAPCEATGLDMLSWTDVRTAPGDGHYYLVRGVNACGPPPAEGWGVDSEGGPRPACP